MSYYPEPDSHTKYKVKVVLDLSNYATEKELDHATDVNMSDLAAEKDFITVKTEVDKLDIAKLVNVPPSLNNLKTKVDDLDVGKLKTVLVDLKKLSDVVASEVVKNKKFNTLKTKLNSLEKKIPDANTFIHINQYNTDEHNLQKKIEDVGNKISDANGLVTPAVLNTKLSKIENKIPDTSNLVTTTVLNIKTSEVKIKISSHDKYITTPEFNKLKAERWISKYVCLSTNI